jgi:hypothetical protein
VPWFPVDDTFHSHPKRLATSAAAIGLWTVAGSWANAHLTDGHIPDYVLLTLFQEPPETIQAWADELVHTRLWKRDRRGGYIFNDWMKWGSKRSARDVRKLRADRAAAGRKGGLASGKTRSKHGSKLEAIASHVLEPPALPSHIDVSVVTDPVRGRHTRPVENHYSNGQSRPGDSPAARHPSARPLAAAQQSAGLNGTPPARGQTVTNIASQARQAITKETTPCESPSAAKNSPTGEPQ